MLADIDKETVDWVPNYDGTEQIPEVLPTRVPNFDQRLLRYCRGYGHQHCPHNLTEVLNGCLALIDNADIDVDGLMAYIPGPDFPTGAFINGRDGIVGSLSYGVVAAFICARHHFEEDEVKAAKSASSSPKSLYQG